jgi:tetratricopeptide (TPR) repeat protein
MLKQALALGLCIALAFGTVSSAQSPNDAEVLKGISQVDDGEYDNAIMTLDTAARRLSTDKSKTNDLAQAYLYLGIAYLGKGREAAAKAKFREAIDQIKDLSLSADKFPPKVVDLFEAARQEAAPEQAKATPAPSPAPSSKKGGGHKGLFIGAGVVAVGAGIAIAAAGGGGGSSSASTPSTTPTTTQPADTRITDSSSGSVPHGGQATARFVMGATGDVEADITWHTTDIVLSMGCQQENAPYTACPDGYTQLSSTTARYTAHLTGPQSYLLYISNYSSHAVTEQYTLTIKHP